MIDIHCHLLPGIDDGAKDVEMALEMARMAVADGVTHIVCTPHALPGLYNNTAPQILAHVEQLRLVLADNDVPLTLVAGADVHVAPDLPRQFAEGVLPTLGRSRYFLLEPQHHTVSPRLAQLVQGLLDAGSVPIITHPERLSWIEGRYELIERLSDMGALMQLTAGSITGAFGRRCLYWAERMLDEGRVDVVASDAHDSAARPPILSRARDILAGRLGEVEATNLVLTRPGSILARLDMPPRPGPISPKRASTARRKKSGLTWLERLRG